MSPAPAMRGTSEKFSGNWVKRKLSRGRARPVTPPPAPTSTRPPPAPGSGRRDFSGYRRRRGGGERKTCHSRLSASPPRTPARRAAWSQAVPAPAPAQAGGSQVAGTRGAQPPARDAPSPRSRPAGPAAPRRSPAIRELAQDTNATRVPAGDAPRAATPCALGRAAVGPAAPSSERPAAAAAAGDWLRPAPPAAPPSSSVENSGARCADARPASRQAARQPRPGGVASPRPEPGAAAAGPPCGL